MTEVHCPRVNGAKGSRKASQISRGGKKKKKIGSTISEHSLQLILLVSRSWTKDPPRTRSETFIVEVGKKHPSP